MNQLVSPAPEERNDYLPQSQYVDTFYRIYNKINETGKEASKSYKNDLLLKFSDIQEIHQKVCQTIKTFTSNSYTMKIIMEQSEGEEHTFRDFESFAHHNTTSPYATQELFFEYKFIIYNDPINKFENYTISFRLGSRIAAFEQMRKQSPDFIVELMAFKKTTIAYVNVEYYDYVKARAFIATFDEWIKGCEENPPSMMMNAAKKITPNLSKYGTFIILTLLAILTIRAIPHNITDMSFILKSTVAYISLFALVGRLSHMLLNSVTKSINKVIPLSYIMINKGDEKLVTKYQNEISSSIRRSLVALSGAVLLGLSTNFIYDTIKIIFIQSN